MLATVNDARQPSPDTLQHVPAHRAIIRELLDHVGDELTLKVTCRLAAAPAGLNELRHLVEGISQRKLTLSLRQLIRNGLAVRRHTETFPSRAEYSLTPLGILFFERVKELVRWVDEHGKEIELARSRFEKRNYKWLSLSEAQL